MGLVGLMGPCALWDVNLLDYTHTHPLLTGGNSGFSI